MKKIIFLGPPGSGKGTQAKILARKLNYFYFGTGEMMREEAEKGSVLGDKFKKAFQKGELVSDDLVEKFVKSKISDISRKKGIIFDGYPRTFKQAETVEKFFNINSRDWLVFNLEVPKDELVKRIISRKTCSRCRHIFIAAKVKDKNCPLCQGKLIERPDDSPEIVSHRIDVYLRETQPLVNYFSKKGVLINIDGRPAIAAISKEINQKLEKQNG